MVRGQLISLTDRYNGTANFTDEAFQVAVAPGGTVFVTGASVVGGAVGNYATIAYKG